MSERIFADCCYGTEHQHLPTLPCPQARLILADMMDIAGYHEDAEHLRKPQRIGDVLVPHPVAIAAMLAQRATVKGEG